MSRILVVIFAMIVGIGFAAGFRELVSRVGRDEPTQSVFKMSKAEYADLAVKNCVEGGIPEYYCRCFYEGLLETNTVDQVLKFDATAMADPEGFEYTPEQLSLAANCLR
jgi:hypothetical protein